ncbi:protein FAM13A isoform X2 [Tachyglossus aculeatus]|uniref:protein FAM13A isoform X2 n=1 Tax=Tachyglossus aculeatus TaxID=9261 RepID=UPI0018F3F1B0|nr:protein FAM13A isoform X2 [Tachyglossus aculeatus]
MAWDTAPRHRGFVDKENIPCGAGNLEEPAAAGPEVEKTQASPSDKRHPKHSKPGTKLGRPTEHQDSPGFPAMKIPEPPDPGPPRCHHGDRHPSDHRPPPGQQSEPEAARPAEERPPGPEAARVSLPWQREAVAADEDVARSSPQAGGLLGQLRDDHSDPLLSPRSLACGHGQRFLDDPDAPPSPPNSHSFMRRRSWSVGSCEDLREDLSPAQLTHRIQGLKKKIRRFEDQFEEERKYRPAHSDKAAHPDVLRWTHELAKCRKQLRDSRLRLSEEDWAPAPMRQRSHTLPRSFGSQLERTAAVTTAEGMGWGPEAADGPDREPTLYPLRTTLRDATGRSQDAQDVTRKPMAAEKAALQKALLCSEGILGRPGSPASKPRSPLLQPIIEGETAFFFKETKEEEAEEDDEDEEEEEDGKETPEVTVPVTTTFSPNGPPDQLEGQVAGGIPPADEKVSPRGGGDGGRVWRLSNLHAAPVPELLEQLQEAREEKRRVRKKLRDFEDLFFRRNGRTVQKEDRGPAGQDYDRYKHLKAELKLLEALITKRGLGPPAL